MATTLSTKLVAAALVLSVLAEAASATCPTPAAPKTTKPSPAQKKPRESCPRDTLKLGACADVLGAVSALVGSPPQSSKCCAVLDGLADFEAALCLCTAIKANVLGVDINVPIALSVLISACQKTVPPGFKCE